MIYICLVSLHERCSIGGYFLDELPNFSCTLDSRLQHILEEELRPSAVKETNDYIQMQLEYLHLQLVSVIT
jgi:hypothetical protein